MDENMGERMIYAKEVIEMLKYEAKNPGNKFMIGSNNSQNQIVSDSKIWEFRKRKGMSVSVRFEMSFSVTNLRLQNAEERREICK